MTGGPHVLAFDLGTGGCKASLWSADGACLAETVHEYDTLHPLPGRAEQRPSDWWKSVAACARELRARPEASDCSIDGIALSGQSLGIVQLDGDGRPIGETTPIWSDTRGGAAASEVLTGDDERTWYLRTGNGFGAALYPLFKARTMREEDPAAWARTRRLIGSKDWINLQLTGSFATDHSYASGFGAYALETGSFDPQLLELGGVDPAMLAHPVESHDRVGALTASAADELGLTAGIPVFAGAVDNACMALGSLALDEGRAYAALGSSSWMTIASAHPFVDDGMRPYVFRHAVPGLHISALSTFSSGTSLSWVRDRLLPGREIADVIDLALTAPPGAHGALFLPMLAGGTPLEGGPAARGGFTGLDLGNDTADLARAALEGVAFSLRRSLDGLRSLTATTGDLLISGGGAQHDGWNQLYADVLGTPLLKTTVDQQAATLGAAAIAFVGLGAWAYADAARPHREVARFEPGEQRHEYEPIRARFDRTVVALAPSKETS